MGNGSKLTPICHNGLGAFKLRRSHNESREVCSLQLCRNMCRHDDYLSNAELQAKELEVGERNLLFVVTAYDAALQTNEGCLIMR
jgi:hypothetical protein